VTNACAGVISSLSAAIDAVVGPLLPPPGTPVALLDFPNHANVGDSAIWLGESEFLRRHGANVAYACDLHTYSRDRLASRLGRDGVILLHGGGNLGDFWYHHQEFRERVIASFPNHRIVQLPQTIFFHRHEGDPRGDDWTADQCARVFNAHRRLTVLCRDERSLEFAKRRFTGPSALCPDMALAVGAIERPCEPDVDVLWLARTDSEAAAPWDDESRAGVLREDWLEEPDFELRGRNKALAAAIAENPADWEQLQTDLGATYDPLARERVARGCAQLSRGRAGITDRLHGHILCTLLGLPHVVLDNSYGKIAGFREAWTKPCALAKRAATPEEAVRVARELARRA
jgi:exopolysaccharide biosynthesis predicted pyruvyltransferase EpsI